MSELGLGIWSVFIRDVLPSEDYGPDVDAICEIRYNAAVLLTQKASTKLC
jgi:hypothetical protein